jgi:hypothetical protein
LSLGLPVVSGALPEIFCKRMSAVVIVLENTYSNFFCGMAIFSARILYSPAGTFEIKKDP